MGTGYLGGAWFFASVVRARRWHEVALGFLPVCASVWAMLGVTVLHWARFDLHHLPFQLWLILYLVTPLLLPALWPFNRRHDPVRPEGGTTLVPTRVHGLMGLIGTTLVASALWMFLFPQAAADLWAWKLTTLTARVMLGWFSLSGVAGLVLAVGPHWSAWRVLLQSMMFWLALLSLGIWRAWAESDLARPAFLAVVEVPLSLIGLAVLYRQMERCAGASARQSAGPGWLTVSTRPGAALQRSPAGVASAFDGAPTVVTGAGVSRRSPSAAFKAGCVPSTAGRRW